MGNGKTTTLLIVVGGGGNWVMFQIFCGTQFLFSSFQAKMYCFAKSKENFFISEISLQMLPNMSFVMFLKKRVLFF